MLNKKIGIMGGTFDPIHYGHLVIANEVLFKFNLEKIIFVPTGNPPHKRSAALADAYHRYMMTQFATMTHASFDVSNIEVEKDGIAYTVDTIRELKKQYKDTKMFFITGTDAVLDLPNWKDPEEILNLCTFIAVNRPGYVTDTLDDKLDKLMKNYNGEILSIKAPQLKISSTDIRNRIEEGRPTKYLLPETVEQYILKKGLYKKYES